MVFNIHPLQSFISDLIIIAKEIMLGEPTKASLGRARGVFDTLSGRRGLRRL